MAWSKSLDQNFKLQREENKKQAEAKQVQQTKKKQNTFYGNYRSKQQSDNTQNTQGNTFQRAVSENPFTPVKTKVYQSYQDRKKSGNVFAPTTVLGQNRRDTDNMSTVIPNVTLSTEKKLGELMRDYETQISKSSTPSEYQRRIHNVMNRHKDVFDEYKRQTGGDLTIPGLQHMYEQYADKTVKQMQESKNEDEENLRSATLKDLTVNSFIRGYANSKLGVENEKAMRGAPNKAAEYKKYLEQDKYQFEPKNWLGKAVSGAIGQAGQMLEGIPEAAAYGGTMAGMVAIAGNAGPQAAIPEEFISVPGAFGTGYAIGSGMHAYKVEAGLAYDEMIDNGISPNTAAGIAAGVGGVNAALEAVQLDDLIKSFNILSKSTGTKGAAKQLGEYILKRGGHIASETAQEVAQEGVTIAGTQAANRMEKGEWAYNADEVKDRLKDTAASSALTFAAMGAGGDLAHIGTNAINEAANNYNNTVNTGREFKNIGSDVVQSVIDTGRYSDKVTSAYKYADKLQNKQEAGRDLSDWNVGRQYQKNVKAIQSENEFATAMSNIKPTEIVVSLYNDIGQELNGAATKENIRVSSNGSQSIPATIKHEWLHMFKNLDPIAYNEYENSVFAAARETNSQAVNKRMNYLMDEYGYNKNIAREEIVAELTGGFNTEAIQRMAEGNVGLATKIASAMRTAKRTIRQNFTDGKYTSNTGLQLTFEQLNNAEKQYIKGLDTARNNTEQTVYGSDVIRYSANEKESIGIKEQIRQNADRINKLSSVKSLKYNLSAELSAIEKRKQIIDTYSAQNTDDNGNAVIIRPNFGDVSVGIKDIQKGFRYLNTDSEYAAVLAVPDIIKNGVEIHSNNNHKNRNYSTFTFAAPVTINGVTGNMAVVVKNTDKYKYKMHRILMPDGTVFEIQNGKNSSYNDGTADNDISGSPSITTVSNNTLSQDGENVKYSFAGKRAKTADIATLEKAQALENSGMSNEDIRTQTGWSKGLDGQWKFEIDDSNAEYLGIHSLKDKFGHAEAPLYQVLKHDKLFKAYPSIKNISVHEWWNIEGNGFYSPLHDDIWVNDSIGLSNEEKLATLLHEVQHAIQMRENFAIGADTKGYGDDYYKSAGEIEARDVKQRINMSEKERKQNFPESMKPREDTIVEPAEDFWKRKLKIKNNPDIRYSLKEKDTISTQDGTTKAPSDSANTISSNGTVSYNGDNVKYSLKENDKVSKLYENTMQKNAYTDEFKTEAERRKPEFMYEGITNKETYTAAQLDIKSRGDNTVLSELSMKDKGWTADDTAKSLALMAKYQTEGDVEKAVDVASMLRDKMTKAGQAVQALKLVNKLTPEGQFIDFTRQSDKMVDTQIDKHPANDKIRRELKEAEKIDRQRRNGNDTEVTTDKSEKDKVLDKYKIEHLSDNDMQEISEKLTQLDSLNSKNDLIELILKQSKERKTASHALVKKALEGQDISFLKDTATMQMFGKIADKMPTTFAKKASAYQAMSHLLNARTMARNIVSNTAFNTVDRTSTNIGSIVDCLMGVFSKQRTVGTDKGVFEKGRFKASADRAVKQYLDIALAVNHDTDSSKYNLNSTRRTFKGRTMGGLERAMSYGLQVTDEWSKGGIEYNIKKSLEGLKNNGFTADEIDRIAKYEAKYRTFQDDTKLSQILSGLKDTLNVIGFGDTQMKGRLKTHEFGLGDLVQKYTQVPGALITRSIEYSPLGYCKALYHIGQAANNARKGASFSSQAQRNIALSLGRAMTGTGLIALFAGLSHLGIFTGEREEEDSKLKAMENAEGISNTQLNLSALSRLITSGDAGGRENGDVLTSLGFLEPLNTLMAMGNAIVEKGNVKNPVDWTKAAGAKTFDQIMDMSTMSTIRSISNTLQYGGGGTDVAIGVISDSATGFVPSPIRQIGSFFDAVQRNPYNEKDELTRARERFKATLPVAREDVAAKITPFGEEKTTTSGNRLIDFANNFFAPGNINIYQTNDISEELYRLSEISTDVLPHVPAKSFTVDKVQFKPRGKEYEKYSRLVGTITADKMRDIINSDDYKNMSDDEKVQALSDAAAEGEKEAKAQFAAEKPSKPSITSFRMPEPKVLSDERQNLQEKQESVEAVSEMLQSISDNLANAVPDKADGYSAKSLQEFDIRTAKIDGKSYEISGDTLHKVAEAATEEYYSNIERLMNNEINVEDVVGYTSKGKTSTATQADGTKVSLTGKLYNEDGTPRFDELVIAKIIRKSKEKAKSNAINKYSDEISGDTVAKNNTSKVETKVSSASTRKHFTSARSSGRKSSGSSKRSSSGGSAEFVRAMANAVTKRSQSRSIAALPDTVSKQAIRSAANAVVKNKGLPNTVKMINNPLFM